MEIIQTVTQLSELRQRWYKDGLQVGFVPTMGNLHQGHMALIQQARNQCDKVMVSIFVNPLQFGDNEDLSHYPRTLDADVALIQKRCDCLFLPQPIDIYPRGTCLTNIDIPPFTSQYCGKFRPHHFVGVLTVVNVLCNLTRPNKAYFGRKDFQQLWLIQRMVRDLHMPVEIIAVDTGRAEDGLALSSRNAYLSKQQRRLAPMLYATLQHIAEQIRTQGVDNYQHLCDQGIDTLQQHGFEVEYLCLCNPKTLQKITCTEYSHENTSNSQDKLLLVAAKLGKARLIDNLLLS